MPGEPGQLEAAGECALNGLSVWPDMYGRLVGPGECDAIGLGCGFNGEDGIRPPLGEGCGICGAGGEVMLKLG